MTTADQHALREALAHLTPDPASHGTISLRSDKAREQVAVIEAALASLIAERDAANKVCDMAAMSGGFYARTAENMERRALAAEAENTRLKETVEGARAALKPFAEEAAIYDPDDGDGDAIPWAGIRLRIKHLRAARSVLATIPPKENPDA